MDSIDLVAFVPGLAPAAVMVFVAMGISFFRGLGREDRYRDLVRPYFVQLREEPHLLIACCKEAAVRVERRAVPGRWFTRAQESSKRLDLVRRQVQYPLREIQDGLRTLCNLAEWLNHWKADSGRRMAFITEGENLRQCLDEVIWEAFVTGSAPTRESVVEVRLASERLQAIWRQGPAELTEQAFDLRASSEAASKWH